MSEDEVRRRRRLEAAKARAEGRDNRLGQLRNYAFKEDDITFQELLRQLKVCHFSDPELLMQLKQTLRTHGKEVANEFFNVDEALAGLVNVAISSGRSESSDKLQLLASQCVANLTPLNEKNGVALARAVGPYLITNLSHGSPQMCEASCVALGNLALAGGRVVRVLLNQEALPSLVDKLSDTVSSSLNLRSAVFYALYHILHSQPDIGDPELRDNLIDECEDHLRMTAPVELYWVLFVLSCNTDLHQRLSSPTLVNKCLDACTREIFMKSDSIPLVKIVTPIVRFLANLSAGSLSEAVCLLVLRYPDILAILHALLATHYAHLCKESLWLLTNIINHDSMIVQEEIVAIELMDRIDYRTTEAVLRIYPELAENM